MIKYINEEFFDSNENEYSKLRNKKIESMLKALGNFDDVIKIDDFEYSKELNLYNLTVNDNDGNKFKFYEYMPNQFGNPYLYEIEMYKSDNMVYTYEFSNESLRDLKNAKSSNYFKLKNVFYILSDDLSIKYCLDNGSLIVKNNNIQYTITSLPVGKLMLDMNEIINKISLLDVVNIENILSSINVELKDNSIFIRDEFDSTSVLTFRNGEVSNVSVFDENGDYQVNIDDNITISNCGHKKDYIMQSSSVRQVRQKIKSMYTKL